MIFYVCMKERECVVFTQLWQKHGEHREDQEETELGRDQMYMDILVGVFWGIIFNAASSLLSILNGGGM